MEFVNWDDEIPHISGKSKMATIHHQPEKYEKQTGHLWDNHTADYVYNVSGNVEYVGRGKP